jgi:arylsulfatase A
MKCHPLVLSLVLVLPVACRTSPAEAREEADRARRPNVVLIYGDDVGYGDLSCYGSTLIPTPNLDRLASEGLRFTDAHCSAATCTPSRFSLLTGILGFRHGARVLPPNAPLIVPTDALTLPEVFRRAGYQTAVVGKWHLGLGEEGTPVDWNGEVRPGPLELGFDASFLLPSTNDRVPCVYLDGHRVLHLDPADPLHVGKRPEGVTSTSYPDGKEHPEAMTYYASTHGHADSVVNGIGRIGTMHGGRAALWDDETMTDVFVERAVEWIEQRDPSQPFFLYYSAQDIHVPRTPHPRFQGVSALGYRGDSMVALDWAAGALMRALEEQGLADDTIVIFTSDNGPVYDDGYDDGTTVPTSTAEVDRGHDGSGPYRGGKYQIYEGGTRVPFVVRWPGQVPAGGTSEALLGQIDLLASFASLLEVDLDEADARDSRDALGALLGRDPVGAPFLVEEAGVLGIRQGSWKLIQRKERVELYDLASDVGEQQDLSARQAARAADLAALLEKVVQAPGGARSVAR